MAGTASEVAGLFCIVIGTAGGLADDLADYLRHAHAQVERTPDLAHAGVLTVGRGGPMVWVIDAADNRQLAQQVHIARARIGQQVQLAVVLIERGKRRRPRRAAHDMVMLDGSTLRRRTFLMAVAVAAGRASLDVETARLTAGKLATIAPSRAEALQQGRLILVAEDNETNQKVILHQLALLGYTADVAADGRAALERWHSGDYALLLTDLHMPHMDGYELTQAIRSAENAGTRIPIIALTANALKGEAEHCLAVGMDDYRSKPSPLAALKAVLDKWLPVAVDPGSADAAPSASRSTTTPPQAAVPVDVNALKALVGEDADLIREFLQDFRSSAAGIALELRTACATGQTKAAAAAAHKLKSSARAVGAFALGEVCAAAEEAGKADNGAALSELLPRFEAEMADVERYLKDIT